MANHDDKKDQESQSEVESSTKGGTIADAADELSLEAIDDLLAEVDPEFADQMSAIKADNIKGDSADDEYSAEYTLESEIKAWKQAIGFHGVLYKIFPFIPKLVFPSRKAYRKLKEFVFNFKDNLIVGLRSLGPWLLKKVKGVGKGLKEAISNVGTSFKTFSKWQKLAAVFLFIFIGVSFFVFFRILTHKGLLPEEKQLFIKNLEEWADSSEVFDPTTEMESFYDSMHGVQNVLGLEKMVVNIQRSTNSSENPMAAFEFVIEGAASEAVVEVKDREPEMRDIFQRTIEEMNYDQLSTPEGKQLMCDRIRKKVNAALTKGKIRRVFIKTVILKP